MLRSNPVPWAFLVPVVLGLALGCGKSDKREPTSSGGTAGSTGGGSDAGTEAGAQGDAGAETGRSSTGGKAGSGGSGGDAGAGASDPGPSGVEGDLDACGLLGKFSVDKTTPVPSCGYGPVIDGIVTIGVDANAGVVVRVGGLLVPMTLGDDCTLGAAACAETGPGGYVEANLAIAPAGTGISGTFAGKLIQESKLETCTSATSFTAVPVESDCVLRGSFTPAAIPALTAGMCDHAWRADPIVVTQRADGYVVIWNGFAFDAAELDEEACTLTTSVMTYEDSSDRKVTLELRLDGDQLLGTLGDTFTGESGVTCDATFSVSAWRGGLATTKLPRDCDAVLPPLCADGTCERDRGEDCKTCFEDCPCASGEGCFGDSPGVCMPGCSVWDPKSCGPGQRCDFVADGSMLSPTTKMACVPSGELGVGERCLASSRCAPGLFCHQAMIWPGNYGVCLPPCSRKDLAEDAPPCKGVCGDALSSEEGFFGGCQIPCDSVTDAGCETPNTFCWSQYPDPVAVCAPAPEGGIGKLAEACDPNPPAGIPSCEHGLNCAAMPDCTSTSCIVCTVDCSNGSPCPDVLPICSQDYGVCVPVPD